MNNQARIDTDEWLYVWQETSELEANYKELKTENKILEDWVKRLEYRIQQLEEQNNNQDPTLFETKEID